MTEARKQKIRLALKGRININNPPSSEILYRLYWTENKTKDEIAALFSCGRRTIARMMKKYGIRTKTKHERVSEKFKCSNIGKKHTEKYKLMMRKRMSGDKNPRYGKPSHWRGKNRSPDTILKLIIDPYFRPRKVAI
jgi:hypothetical protein